ncbi:flagellar filament capping protein FliD [Paenibacillus validus]|uniref:Flagellar hook-associated protein 2 n=1 Tax=Paenibacillus validus TaxID=44253 RepID=A0A7X3CTJ3_9BACL|nr:flagellar filament capping protein FliD [Paenibacillus validus]MUG72502.1 flagellar filament capping protein FliD [Paenibacillus validus]
MINRVSGLASGIDTEGLISQLMQAKRASVDKLYQNKQTIQWQREAYRDMNTKIYDFRNNKLSSYRLEGTFAAKTVDVAGNAAAISAKATGNAVNGTFKIEVKEMATAASNYSAGDIRKTGQKIDPTLTLSTQVEKFDVFDPGGNEFTINGTKVKFDPTKDSLNNVIDRINKTTDVNAFYDSTTGFVSFVSKNTGLVNNPSDPASDSAAPGTNLGERITFSGNFLTQSLKVATGGPNEKVAVSAKVSINGMPEGSYASNKITVNGVEVTLLKKDPGNPATLTVDTDTNKIMDTVKAFVKDYNDILQTLNDKLNEARYKSFQPLTDTQKKDMKESDITQWEEKAKSGMLKNDDILSRAVSTMRLDVFSQVETGSKKYKTLASIGIETGEYIERGKLYIKDESKLKEAIEKEPEAIMALFTATGNGDSDQSDVGIAKRLYDHAQLTLNEMIQKAGSPGSFDTGAKDQSYIGKKLYLLDKDIDVANERIKNQEDMYYRKFTAMEAVINKYNSQSSYLSQLSQ